MVALAACAADTSDGEGEGEAAEQEQTASAPAAKELQIAQLPPAPPRSADDAQEDAQEDDDVTSTTVHANGTIAAAPPSRERAVVAKLGAPSRFLVGLGNDQDGNGADKRAGYALGSKIDIHYMYLSGLGWPTWSSPKGAYVKLEAEAARRHGAIPMFTLYQAAVHGDGNLAPFDTDSFMTQYWANVRLMFEQLSAFGDGAIVHVEPDFWGYAQKKSNDDPAAVRVRVGALVPECKDLPSDVRGFGKCIVRLARKLAPNVVIGLSASSFGATSNGVSQPEKIGAFMNEVGAVEADILVLETLDRDAGCFEAGTDPSCKRAGSFYWADKDFANHLAWAKTLREKTGKPLLWWQMPLGVPSSSPGSAGKYRDNRVKYLFAHADEFAAAGGIGAVFGTGAANQTTVKTDGGQFKNALAKYLAAPTSLR
ncbi:MAG: hypothetical protein KIT84_39090 [Labilithrix sp.]|nr:hypothetical protein [Labilithrix sp.]